jgi:carboxymethylenebutenolidase
MKPASLVLFMSVFFGLSQIAIAADGPPAQQPEIVYFPSGNLTLGGELYMPQGKGPFPAVLYNHGSAAGFLSDQASQAIGPLYAAKGWIFFMPYRRGQGWSAQAGIDINTQIQAAYDQGGQSAANATMNRLLTTDHLDDQLAALDWLKSQSFVQKNRIAVDGQSFGGIEVVLGAEKYSYCAAVDAAGASMSWTQNPDLHTVMKSAVRNSQSPVFFFQAANDWNTEPSQVLYAEMIAARKTARVKIYPAFGQVSNPDDGHSFAWLGSAIWFDDVFAFIQQFCKG